MTYRLLSLLALVVMFNCSSSDDNDGESSSCEFTIPFVVEGHMWTSNLSQFGFDAGQLENEVLGCGNNGMQVSLDGPTGSVISNWKQEDGYLWTDANDAVDGFNRFYKINAQVGDMFSYTRNDGSVYTSEVIAVDSMITVPAGTFACDVYKRTSPSIINEIFTMWNHEVGQIKSDSGFVLFELASYNFD